MSALSIKRSQPAQGANAWRAWGLTQNPFVASAVTSSVLYSDHVPKETLDAINAWLAEATGIDHEEGTSSTQPLALKGEVGTGKTHWMGAIRQELERFARDEALEGKVLISDHRLNDPGAKLSVGALLHEGIGGQRLVPRTLTKVDVDNYTLPSATLLREPLARLARSVGDDRKSLEQVFEDWLLRRPTAPRDLSRLGVSGALDVEGQWVRALAHFAQLARHYDELRFWVVLIDQLEDLWRPHVTTPLRRARFLTELRALVDLGFEGVPIHLAMAWNTAVDPSSLRGVPKDVTEQLQRDYRALFTRIFRGKAFEIPKLRPQDAASFALAFVDALADEETAGLRAFKRRVAIQASSLFGVNERTAREWLDQLRTWAEDLVKSGAPVFKSR